MVEIEWSPTAESDLDGIIDYIGQDSPQYARSFLERIRETIENLEEFPRMGRQVHELDDPNVRELIILKNYRLIYRLFGEKIQIIRIIHASRLLKF